ncbi:MAG TPA: divalent-cation tolerance protein CutA [Acidimicrobiales bacterium]|nr:divalent-cation tolerance protein CutA [Acidimicrobiales bacterium]
MDHDLVQVTTTAPDEATASTIASTLLDAHLAACVQVDGPIRSRYWWDGELDEATEWRCVAKSTAALARRIVDAIVEVHPYDVPEVLVTPVVDAHSPYADWVRDAVSR